MSTAPVPRSRGLWIAVIAAWAAWLSFIAIIAVIAGAHTLHPSVGWIAAPLAVQSVGTLGVLVLGIRRLYREPRRWFTAGAISLGLLPALLLAAYLAFLVDYVTSRSHSSSLLTRSADAAVVMLAEPIVRFQYPWRQEGERVVMWSSSPNGNVQQLEAMDAHIRQMEQLLNYQGSTKVNWIRGSVCTLEGVYLLGWILGSDPAMPADGSDGLNTVDRHEAAHFVLDEAVSRGEDVASILDEGWAELQSGSQEVKRSRQEFRLARFKGRRLSLQELTSPDWYYSSEDPIYPQGCALVEYLLRQFGPEKFLALCRTCTQATFAEDVQRTLGVTLEELDQAYQEE